MVIKNIFKEYLLSTSSVIIVISLIPTFILILLPIYLIRQVVKLLAKILHPEFTEMLYGLTSIMAAQGVHQKHKSNNRGTSITISFLMPNTKIDMEKIYEIAEAVLQNERFIKAKVTLVKWMGFYFWKYNPNNFDLKSHFILHEEPITPDEFYQLVENELLDEPYPKQKPLWVFHFFSKYIPETLHDENNKNPNNSAMVLKIHHCLGDWTAIIDILNEVNDCYVKLNPINPTSIKFTNPLTSKVKVPSMNTFEKIYFALRLFLLGPFQLVRELIVANSTTIKNSTQIQPLKAPQSFQVTVPFNYLKSIAVKNGVSTPALTFAGYVGALRQLLIDLEVNPLPDVSITGPVPLPWKRPWDFNNYFVTIPINAPIKEEDPFKRLALAHKSFEQLKKSTKPLVFHAFYSILGGLFHWMLDRIAHTPFGGAAFTIAPGPQDLGQTLGVNITNFIVTGGMPFGDSVMLGFYSFSVKGQVMLRITGDSALFKNHSSSKRFIDLLLKEFKIFEKIN